MTNNFERIDNYIVHVFNNPKTIILSSTLLNFVVILAMSIIDRF